MVDFAIYVTKMSKLILVDIYLTIFSFKNTSL